MKTPLSKNRKFTRMFVNILRIFVILAMAFPATSVAHAAPSSPFVGKWAAVDVDGSDLSLVIGGPAAGPFQITWTDKYISFCNGEAGIVRGTGWLDDVDPNLLEADVLLECFTTGGALPFHVTFRYHPVTNTLSTKYSFGQVTIWHRPGGGQAEEVPALGLRVNYGHDWVESFYEGGHTAWLTVTDADGNLKATSELMTEPKDYWGGETGFQSLDGIWFDGDGNQIEYPPDILPNDWVYGWVDNGASAQVQIGNISGTVDLANDSIGGTIYAPWFTDPVQVECLDWGSGQELPFDNKDGGSILTNGADLYSCSWYEEWDIQPYQDVGVAYSGPDGNWVANAVFARNSRIVASEAGDWFWTSDFNPGTLNLSIYETAEVDAPLLWSGQSEADQSGFTIVGYDIHGQDLVPGNYLVVSDGVNEKGLVLQTITMEVFDTENESMAGTAPLGRDVRAVAGMAEAETQASIDVVADAQTGAWMADFSTIPFDITEEMRPWSFAQIFDEDGDANEAGTPPPPPSPRLIAFPVTDEIFAYNWPEGSEVTLTINGEYMATANVQGASWDPNDIMAFFDFGEQHDLATGDDVVLSGSDMELTYIVQNLSVTEVNEIENAVTGTADPGVTVMVYPFEYGDQPLQVTADGNGTWFANFGKAGIDLLPGMCGRSDIFDEFTNSTTVDWCIPNPVIFAWLEWDQVDGHGWREGETITLTVNGDEHVLTQVAGNTKLVFDLGAAGHDLTVGDRITLSDGLITKELLIPEITVTDYDLGANTVSGTYDPNLGFRTYVSGEPPIDVTFDKNLWTAYYDDIGPLMWGDAVQRDADSDEVAATIRTPNPVFYVVPDEERIYASEWTPGETLRVNINGSETASQTVPSNGSPYGPEVLFDLNGVFDLQFGDVITLTDGRSSKELVVATLQVTGFDLGTHTIFGIADPGPLFIGVNGEDMWIDVGEDSIWSASSPGFEPLEWGSVIKSDEDGDQTRDIFMIPRPMMYAFADDDVVAGTVWTEGQPLTLQIYDAVSGGLVYEKTEIVPPPSVVPWTAVHFYLREAGYDLKPGDRLVMSQNGYERELVMSSLRISGFNLATQTIMGTGDPGANFLIRMQGLDKWSTVNADGTWSVYHEYLQPGVWGEAIQPDVDGDETRDGFQVPFE